MNHSQSLFHRGIALAKREYWENRKTITYSLTGIIVLIFIFTIFAGSHHSLPMTKLKDSGYLSGITAFYLYSTNLPLQVVMWIVICFYLLGSLYSDRKDNSILFWQSLPVSQTETVISKIIWACLLIPTISVIFMIINGILTMTVAVFYYHLPHSIWSIHGLFIMTAQFIRVYAYQLIIFLPILGWCLFCSAFAKKHPLLLAFLIPLTIEITDSILNKGYISAHTFEPASLALIKLNVMGSLSNLPLHLKRAIFTEHDDAIFSKSISIHNIGLSTTFVTIGALVGLAFIIIAINLRARNYGKEI